MELVYLTSSLWSKAYAIRQKKCKNKKVKSIFAKYSDIETIEKQYLFNIMGKSLAIFNEAGFLEIGIYKSNPKIGSASSLLGLEYRDFVMINFNI